MFQDLIDWPLTSDRLQWQGKQVLRELRNEPHLFCRIRITGTHFEQRGLEAFMNVGSLRSRFVEISADGLTADGYFDHPPPIVGDVEFGYGHTVLLRCRRGFNRPDMKLLRRALMPPNVQNLERFESFLG